VSSTAQRSFALCHTFEAELLLELMLRHWNHPLADDREYRNHLLETATAVLNEAVRGTTFVDGVPPADTNFVAAVYYAETLAFQECVDPPQEHKRREAWLTSIRRCLPSCFCDPRLLG
jgi:hypothetical protein